MKINIINCLFPVLNKLVRTLAIYSTDIIPVHNENTSWIYNNSHKNKLISIKYKMCTQMTYDTLVNIFRLNIFMRVWILPGEFFRAT